MIKQKVYDIAGTNCENMGSDLEKKVKLASAQSEDAWHGVGTTLGLRVWRIEKFHVKAWPESQYGTFYNGDSYIVLHTYTDDNGKYLFDIHFWLGTNTTMDEAGTAAYKTVELDTFLEMKGVQHREVEGYESKLFMSYFSKTGFYILEGGIESGFFHVTNTFTPRLLKVKGVAHHIHVRQVELNRESLNVNDVFVLDLNDRVFQFNGLKCSHQEKLKAAQVVVDIKHRRGKKVDLTVIDQDSPTDDDDDFWAAIGGRGPIREEPDGDNIEKHKHELKLLRMTESGNNLSYEFVAEGAAINPSLFHSDDVYFLDKGYIIYVWIGSSASKAEKHQGITYAQKYIAENHHNIPLPITVFPQSSVHAVAGLLR